MSFLKNIRKNPEDDNLKLAYADYLEEQGDPQAELIRIQIELEKLTIREKQLRGKSNIEFRKGIPYHINVYKFSDLECLNEFPTIYSAKFLNANEYVDILEII